MISLPIIFREFKVAARRKRTFIVRFVFGGLLAFMTLLFLIGYLFAPMSSAVGRALLSTFTWQLFIILFMVAPAFTCGCIAEEKKNGTLGLLFLTHLNSGDIVLGKFIGRGFDVFMLFVSAAPFLFVPILMGGVGWDETMSVIFTLLSLLLLALSIGVFASTITPSSGAAAIVAYFFLIAYNVVLVFVARVSSMILPFTGGAEIDLPNWLKSAAPLGALWSNSLHDSSISLLCSATVSAVLLLLSVWRLPRTLDRVTWRERLFRFRHRNAVASVKRISKLRPHRLVQNKNPIFWLNFGRAGRWNWTLQGIVALGLFCWEAWAYYAWTHDLVHQDMVEMLFYVGKALDFFITLLVVFYVSRSFAPGKQDGSLELLLISPLSNQQIVWGKLKAVLGHYGLLFGTACGLVVTGGFPSEKGYALYSVTTSISGFIYAVCVCMLISAWSKSAKQAIALSFLATIVFGWVMSAVNGFALAMVEALAYYPATSQATLWSYTWADLIRVMIVGIRFSIEVGIAYIAYRALVKNLRQYAAA